MYRNDPRPGAAAPGAGTPGEDGQPAWLITLVSSLAPLPLVVAGLPELPGAMVFRSRRVEDGRERFRLHVGYFATEALANATLERVRDAYPAAFVEPAPDRGLGSLEDTGIAQFRVLQWGAPVEGAEPAPSSVSSPSASPSPSSAAAPQVSPAPTSSRVPPAGIPATAAAVRQQYSVQLAWAREAIDCTKLPRLPIFGSYLTYAVETESGGRRWYGVRLGFFRDLTSAQLVAEYIRGEYAQATVVPVSDREVTRASGARIRLPQSRAPEGSRAGWPAAAVPVVGAPRR